MADFNISVKYTRFLRYEKIPFDIPTHTHPYCEIVYYTSGTGYGCIEGTKYRYTPNSYVFIPTGTEHSEYAETVSAHYLIGLMCNKDAPTIPAGFHEDDSNGILPDLFGKIQEELRKSLPYYETCIDALAKQILIYIARRFAVENEKASSKIDMAINFMNSHFDQEIDLHELAKSTYYSYDYFRHLFAKFKGTSPQRYLLNLRLEHATRQLEQTGLPLSSIAQGVGYHSAAAFSIDFKKKYGKTPSEYRASYTPNQQNLQYKERHEEE